MGEMTHPSLAGTLRRVGPACHLGRFAVGEQAVRRALEQESWLCPYLAAELGELGQCWGTYPGGVGAGENG